MRRIFLPAELWGETDFQDVFQRAVDLWATEVAQGVASDGKVLSEDGSVTAPCLDLRDMDWRRRTLC